MISAFVSVRGGKSNEEIFNLFISYVWNNVLDT